jgi:hypothetical protein
VLPPRGAALSGLSVNGRAERCSWIAGRQIALLLPGSAAALSGAAPARHEGWAHTHMCGLPTPVDGPTVQHSRISRHGCSHSDSRLESYVEFFR